MQNIHDVPNNSRYRFAVIDESNDLSRIPTATTKKNNKNSERKAWNYKSYQTVSKNSKTETKLYQNYVNNNEKKSMIIMLA